MPSWAYGNSGTRFKVFAQPGVPRTAEEKIADAATVHRFTGVAPTVALHIPWDKVDDYAGLGVRRRAGRRARRDQHQRLPGRRLQARQRHQPRPGGPAQGDRPPARVRRHHGRDRLARPEAVVLRRHQLPGPGRHAGPAGPARRRRCAEIYAPARRRPADAAGVQALRAGLLHHRRAGLGHLVRALPRARRPKAKVCIDTGHHAPGTNIEFIVAFLLRRGKLGAFDFNSRFYADDDLMVGAADPFQLFRIMHEIVRGGALGPGAAGSRSCSTSATTSRRRSPAIIRSVMNVQEAAAKALLVDRDALRDGPATTATCSRRTRR